VFDLAEAGTHGRARNFSLHAFTEDKIRRYTARMFQAGYPLLDSSSSIITHVVKAGMTKKYLEDVKGKIHFNNSSLASDAGRDDCISCH
jgi:hypothetical protein